MVLLYKDTTVSFTVYTASLKKSFLKKFTSMKSNKNHLTLLLLRRKTFCCYNQDVPQHRFCCRYFNNLSYRLKRPAEMNRAASTEELFFPNEVSQQTSAGFRCVQVCFSAIASPQRRAHVRGE